MPRARKYNKVTANDRARIFKAYEEEKDWRQCASNLGVNLRTAYDWIKNDQEFPKPKGGKGSKKNPEVETALVRWVEEDSTLTLRKLVDRVQNQFGIQVCINTIKNWLDGKLFSVKATRPHIANVNSIENKVKRRQYVEKILKSRANGRTLIWIDECNFNLYCRRKEGRSKIGHRAHVITPSSKGSNLHCIGAMCATQIVSFEHRRGSYKAQDCQLWLRNVIEICNNNAIHHPTFIIDNAPIHANLEGVIQEHENIEIVRLAPYSYLLNPIELLWSSFKSKVKSRLQERMPEILNYVRANNHALTISEFRMQILEAIADECMADIPHQQQLLGFTNHVERYYAAASREENLVEQ